MKMARERTQLNINIDPNLLLQLKSEAIKNGQTLAQYVTQQLEVAPKIEQESVLEQRLSRIEEKLGLNKSSTVQKEDIGVIFTDEGAKNYGDVAKAAFDSQIKKKGVTVEEGLKEILGELHILPNSHPELIFAILLGKHELTGAEMTSAYRHGSCAMRTALVSWCNDPLEELNDAFLNAVISKNLV